VGGLKDLEISENQKFSALPALEFCFVGIDKRVRSGSIKRHGFFNPTTVANPRRGIIADCEANQEIGRRSASDMST
jgi:hypothetical protein